MPLKYLKESIDFIMQYRGDEIDEEFQDTITTVMCKDISDKYIFLPTNNEYYSYVEMIKNISPNLILNSPKLKEKSSFDLFHLLKNSDNAEEALDYLKVNSIILENNQDALGEFYSTVNIMRELSGHTLDTYLLKQYSEFSNLYAEMQIEGKIDGYWSEKTKDDAFIIKRITRTKSGILLGTKVVTDIFLPQQSKHDVGILDLEDFFQDQKNELEKIVSNVEFVKSLVYDIDKCFVFLQSNFMPVEITPNGKKIIRAKIIDNTIATFTEGLRNRVKWKINFILEPRDFVQRLIQQYL